MRTDTQRVVAARDDVPIAARIRERALRVTVQTMSATLERLEQLEYVERSRDPYDRLRSLCRLTEKDRLALSEVDTDESPLLDDDRRDELLRQLLIELITRHPDRDGVDAHNAIADHE